MSLNSGTKILFLLLNFWLIFSFSGKFNGSSSNGKEVENLYGLMESLENIPILNRLHPAHEVETGAGNLEDGFPSTITTPILLNSNNPGFEKGDQDWNFVKRGSYNRYGEIRVVQNGQSYSGQKQLYLKLPRQAISNYDDQISIGQDLSLSNQKRYAVEAYVKWLKLLLPKQPTIESLLEPLDGGITESQSRWILIILIYGSNAKIIDQSSMGKKLRYRTERQGNSIWFSRVILSKMSPIVRELSGQDKREMKLLVLLGWSLMVMVY